MTAAVRCQHPCPPGRRRCRACYLSAQAAEERFWSRVDKSGECWVWTAGRMSTGYGYFNFAKERRGAHRAAWEFTYGPIPDGLHVCHHCDNPPCVRPDHLFVGTRKDNMRDMLAKGRESQRIWDGTQVRLMAEGRARNGNRKARGERHPFAKFTEVRVREVRARAATGESQRALAREFGVARNLIFMIVHRQIWRHVA